MNPPDVGCRPPWPVFAVSAAASEHSLTSLGHFVGPREQPQNDQKVELFSVSREAQGCT